MYHTHEYTQDFIHNCSNSHTYKCIQHLFIIEAIYTYSHGNHDNHGNHGLGHSIKLGSDQTSILSPEGGLGPKLVFVFNQVAEPPDL